MDQTKPPVGDRQILGMAEAVPVPSWLAALDGSCVFVNRAWCAHTGLSVEGSLGWNWLQAVHPDDHRECSTAWAACLQNGGPFTFELRLRRSDGTYGWFHVHAELLLDAVDAPTWWFGTAEDTALRLSSMPILAAPSQDSTIPVVRRRVLIADDNGDAADTVALLVAELGCDVRTVYGDEPAYREAEAFKPEVVFLDLGMPDLDGRDVCKQIRSQPWGANMMLVALTGWGRDEDRRRTRLAGFDEHIVKPADSDVLVRLLRQLPQGNAQ